MSNLKWMYNPEWEYYTLVSASELREADKEYGIDKLKRELNAANERIRRLEEAGDVMYKLLNPPSISMRTIEYDNALQGWDDAKIKS